MKKTTAYAFLATLVSFVCLSNVSAQTSTTTKTPSASSTTVVADPGLTPDSPFYFLDKFGEQLDLLLTFNKEEKARLRVAFAKERIAEIKEMLSTGSANKTYIDSAKSDAKENLTSANAIIAEEKKNGGNTASLEKDLSEDYDSTKHEFESYSEDESHNIEREQKKLSKEMEVKGISEEKKNELKAKIHELDDKKSLIKEIGDDEELNKAEDELSPEVDDDTDEVEPMDKENDREKGEFRGDRGSQTGDMEGDREREGEEGDR